MTYEERKKVYKKLEDKNSRKHQMLVAIEEFSELSKELTKLLRNDGYTNKKNICDEIADVKVCVEQLELFFDSNNNLVPVIMDWKIKRLEMFYLNDNESLAKSMTHKD